MPLGEMLDLEKLAQTCREKNRWFFFFSSAPANCPGTLPSFPSSPINHANHVAGRWCELTRKWNRYFLDVLEGIYLTEQAGIRIYARQPSLCRVIHIHEIIYHQRDIDWASSNPTLHLPSIYTIPTHPHYTLSYSPRLFLLLKHILLALLLILPLPQTPVSHAAHQDVPVAPTNPRPSAEQAYA
jgi:hypothetical protein